MEWAHPNQCFQQIFFISLSEFPGEFFAPPICHRELIPKKWHQSTPSPVGLRFLLCEMVEALGKDGEDLDPSPLGSLLTWMCSVFWSGRVILLGLSKHCGNSSHYADGHRDRGLLRTRVCQAQTEELWKPYKRWFLGVLCGSYYVCGSYVYVVMCRSIL